MRKPEERRFSVSDGTSLFYRYWPAVAPMASATRALILLHRGHEHSGRLQHVVDEVDLPDFAMFGWDARGHGMSPLKAGDRPTFGTFTRDLDAFAHHVSETFGVAMENIAVVAQSIGSVLAAAWVHDYAPPIRCMVLASPAFKVKLYVPLARPALSLLTLAIPNLHVKSYIKGKALTHDKERIESYESDPLITRPISVSVLLGLYATSDRIVKDAQAIRTPTQLLISGADWVVHRRPQRKFFENLGSAVKEKHEFAGFFHDTLGEKDRKPVIAEARGFIVRCFETPCAQPRLEDADQHGFTCTEFKDLSRPLPVLSPQRWIFGVTKVAMRTGGRLSNGIQIGIRTGFDSGSTLDYVYRNQPAGITPVGRLIDWFYLNSIGWRGIRIRKEHLERLLIAAVKRLRDSGQAVRVVDIAAGHGRYALEAFESHGSAPDRILLRDFAEQNVVAGQALIRNKGMADIATFERGDAFDRQSLAGLEPRPTLGIVSGLYELFPENAPLQQSLAGLAHAIAPGGYLIYTGQPWHPQLEMIGRVLTSHREGKPWVMRRRTQEELDQLVAAAGFRKVEQLADDWGIFTVSTAQRLEV